MPMQVGRGGVGGGRLESGRAAGRGARPADGAGASLLIDQLLRFDSRRPNAKFRGVIDLLRDKLANVLVIGSQSAVDAPAPYYCPPPALQPSVAF